MAMSKVFEAFTKKYAVSKTLRFELKPVGETLKSMKEAFRYDEKIQTFFADQEIENAYQNLKPILDKIHEEFITESLESEKAKQIPFDVYEESYRKKSELSSKEFEAIEKKIRSHFDGVYKQTAQNWKENAPKNKKGEKVFTKDSPALLTEAGIVEYIRQNAEKFSHILLKEEIEKHLNVFDGFFTYFSGFSQNRENYYATKDEKVTAVATRIVSENLPKFCDNAIAFENKKSDYLSAYTILSEKGITLEMKDGFSGKMKPLKEIDGGIFLISHFNQCLSQKEVDIYNNDIANANYLVNLYNQLQVDKKNKLKLFKTLYKQIGCGEKETFIKNITHETEEEAKKAREQKGTYATSLEQQLKEFAEAGEMRFFGRNNEGLIETIEDFQKYLFEEKEDFTGVYWSKQAINTISGRYFSNWHSLKDTLKDKKVFNKSTSKDEEVSVPEVVELEKLFAVLDTIENWKNAEVLFRETLTEEVSEDHKNFEKNKKRKQIIEESGKPSEALLKMIFDDMFDFRETFSSEKENVLNNTNYKTKEGKDTVKHWLDSGIRIIQILKYFSVQEKKIKDNPFDAKLREGLNILLLSNDVDWFTRYDLVRNYLTKRPQDDTKENKLKLNFQNSKLAGGWDVNKESANSCVILREGEKIFLAVVAKSKGKEKNSALFRKTKQNPLFNVENEVIEKMEYKLLPGPNKMLPKCLLPKSNPKKYGADDKILDIYRRGSFKKSEANFSKQDLYSVIDFYKEALKKYDGWNCFTFHFKDTNSYADISEFYLDVEKQGYVMDFVKIDKNILSEYISNGKIYLFEIRNKDWNTLSDGSKKLGKRNLHTIYWKALFEEIKNRPKLNGEAEIFYRKALSKNEMEKATRKDGRSVLTKKGEEAIKQYRFSQEKFLLHVPITLNFCLKDYKINDVINNKLLENDSICFLGIDRGEKHLAYYSVVDSKGNILEQDTLNVINGKDYNAILEERSTEMDKARKSWQTIGTIKELKDGYISQVIRKIVNLSLQYNAFIVLEDLNVGFKQGRQKIEKSVYQKLELALAKKLNFLVDKSSSIGEVGSVTRALQLTPPVNTFGDMENRKQFGIMLYTRANYTSQTDPATGWRKMIYLKRGSEEFIKKSIIEEFDDIFFDGKDYVFSYIEKFGKDKERQKYGKKWNLYSGKDGISLDRFRGKRGKEFDEWSVELIDIVQIFDGLFEDFDKNISLLDQIQQGKDPKKINEYTAYETLRFAIDTMQQIRNSGEKGNKRNSDFLHSPVRKENGEHYDSRIYLDQEKSGKTLELPVSGDANGAYNIARKGILMREHLKRDLSVYISDEEWSMWLSGKDAWDKWIKENEKDLKKKKK